MKVISQIEDKTQSAQAVERIQSDNVRIERAEEKKKKIPDNVNQLASLVISQLPPETVELIQKFAALSQQTAAAKGEPQVVAQESAQTMRNVHNALVDANQGNSETSQVGTLKSSDAVAPDSADANSAATTTSSLSKKDRANLDDMLLAALSSVFVPQPPVPVALADSAADNKDAQADDKHRLKGIEKDSSDQIGTDNAVDQVNQQYDNQNAAPNPTVTDNVAANANAQSAVVAQQHMQTPVSDQKQQSGMSVDSASDTTQIGQIQQQRSVQNKFSDVALHDKQQRNSAQDEAGIGSEQAAAKSLARQEDKEKDISDAASAMQAATPAPTMPNVLNAPVPQPQQPSQTQQAMEQHRTKLAKQDRAGSAEGIRYNLDSWGKNQSVQIVGSNKTGYTLRPSDGEVKRVLEKHEDDSLGISIAASDDNSSKEQDL